MDIGEYYDAATGTPIAVIPTAPKMNDEELKVTIRALDAKTRSGEVSHILTEADLVTIYNRTEDARVSALLAAHPSVDHEAVRDLISRVTGVEADYENEERRMRREDLIKGEWYAAKEYDSITRVQILDLSPWAYGEDRSLVPARSTVAGKQSILIYVEDSGELDLLHEDEIVATWAEHTALERWIRAEKKWKAEQISNKVLSTTRVLKDVLELSGIPVVTTRWNEPFAEISIRINVKGEK